MQRRNSVKAIRRERGYTQATLAAMIGVKKETISKIERHVQHITEPQAHRLATVLKVAIDNLYESGLEPLPGFAEEAVPFIPDAGSFEARVPLDEDQKWYQIKKNYLDQIGYWDGMLVVIDISNEAIRKLEIGGVVIANKHSENGSAETIVRQFIPPSLLITNSLHTNLQILNLASDDVTIFGIIIHPRALPLAVPSQPRGWAWLQRAQHPA
jgi:DNA-binding XRE family transcriptional regulator